MRVAFYSHDTFGLGHLRRCLKLAAALHRRIENLEGIIVTGSPWAGLFPCPQGFGYWPLVPVTKTAPGAYAARQPGVEFSIALAMRRAAIARALEHFRPDLLIVDNVPCGLEGELLPALRTSGSGNRPKTVLALRDVLDAPKSVEAQWTEADAYRVVEECYDEVWVFGDACSPSSRHDHLLRRAARNLVFCGPIGCTTSSREGRRDCDHSARSQAANQKRRPVVLVTGGGGGDAAEMFGAYAGALQHAAVIPSSHIVLGPDFVGAPPLDAGAPHVQVDRFCPDLPSAIALAFQLCTGPLER